MSKNPSLPSGWSGANANSFISGNPWFIRGGRSENLTGAGVESISNANGGVNTNVGFRGVVVIRP
ncbi:hypothetical protein FWH09_03325 [Candidatus Saccharibacteria bacterium]|nr:hypothetical protein [Candidatus Saccharibacteria bacterium]